MGRAGLEDYCNFNSLRKVRAFKAPLKRLNKIDLPPLPSPTTRANQMKAKPRSPEVRDVLSFIDAAGARLLQIKAEEPDAARRETFAGIVDQLSITHSVLLIAAYGKAAVN